MALRTSETLVKEVVVVASGQKLNRYMTMANLMINQLAAADTGGLADTDTLRELETLLAAHYYQHNRDLQYSSKSTGRASASFQSRVDMGFAGTHPGQDALRLDPTGFLARRDAEAQQGTKRVAGASWGGTAYDSPRPDGRA